MGDNSPIAYERSDGVIVIRASAMGKCVRALWAVLNGVEPAGAPEYLSRAAAEGNLHEGPIRDKLALEYERDIYGDQDLLELWIIPGRLVIVGHPDGFMEAEDKGGLPDLVEIKTMSRAVFEKWMDQGFDSNPGYAWQISVYMLAAGWPEKIEGTVYAAKRRDDGLMDEGYFTEPPISLRQIRQKAVALYKAHYQGEMPECDIPEGKRWGCPVYFLHDEDEVPKETEQEAPDLDTLAAEYLELSKTSNYARTRQKEIKAEMEEFRDGRDAWSTENFIFKIARVKRRTLDKAAITVEHGPDFLARYEDINPYDRWTIKEKG
jgi:hypothetical protein